MSGPVNTVAQLVEAINRADLDVAVALYEKDAVLVAQPGRIARGTAQLREALAGFTALKSTLCAPKRSRSSKPATWRYTSVAGACAGQTRPVRRSR